MCPDGLSALGGTGTLTGGSAAAGSVPGLFGSPLLGSPLFGSPLFGSPLLGSPLFGSPLFGSLGSLGLKSPTLESALLLPTLSPEVEEGLEQLTAP
jgi:hypothetical protein